MTAQQITKAIAEWAFKKQDSSPIYHRDLIGDQAEVPELFCQKCTKPLTILWDPEAAKDGDYRAIGAVCLNCFHPEEFDTYYEDQPKLDLNWNKDVGEYY